MFTDKLVEQVLRYQHVPGDHGAPSQNLSPNVASVADHLFGIGITRHRLQRESARRLRRGSVQGLSGGQLSKAIFLFMPKKSRDQTFMTGSAFSFGAGALLHILGTNQAALGLLELPAARRVSVSCRWQMNRRVGGLEVLRSR